jgi:hypothetical protein
MLGQQMGAGPPEGSWCCHRCLQHKVVDVLGLWHRPDPPTAPPRGPAIDVFNDWVVVAAKPIGSTPRGPTIDVFID